MKFTNAMELYKVIGVLASIIRKICVIREMVHFINGARGKILKSQIFNADRSDILTRRTILSTDYVRPVSLGHRRLNRVYG